MEQSLIDANMPRAAMVAELCADRMSRTGQGGAWAGYRASEGLEGVLVQDKLMRYARPGTGAPGYPEFAVLFFRGPKLTDIKEVDWGEEIPVKQDVIERYKSSIQKIKGVEYDDTISHTFSKIVTLMQAFKIGVELAIKAFFKASYSGVEGGAEISAKFTAEYSRQWGETETHTDTVTRHLRLPPEFEGDIHYEAVRSVDKVQREIKAVSNMDYDISFVSGPLVPPANHPLIEMNWGSLEEFISVGKGFAAADKAMYGEFMDKKLVPDEIEQLRKLGEQSVEFMTNYEKVNSQDIRIL